MTPRSIGRSRSTAVAERTPELSIIGSVASRRLLVMRSGSHPVGDLVRERRGVTVRARWGDHEWTFQRMGVVRPRVLLRHQGSRADVGWFLPDRTGGRLLMATRTLGLAAGHLGAVSLVDRTGAPVVTLSLPRRLFAPWAAVRIAPALAGTPEAPLAALFLTYLRWQRGADVEAAHGGEPVELAG